MDDNIYRAQDYGRIEWDFMQCTIPRVSAQ